MLLLRSGEEGEGETVDLRTLAALARDWYGDRLDPAWRPRSAEESQRILGAARPPGGVEAVPVPVARERGERAQRDLSLIHI